MLILPIKKKWFDMIACGEKKEEYREIKDYYNKCLGKATIGFTITESIIENFESIKSFSKENANQFKDIDIIFRNGYRNDSPKIRCQCDLRIGQGKEEWGAEPEKRYYILDILSVEVSNRS